MPPQQKKRKASVEVFSASEDEEEEIPPMKARPTKRGYSTRLSAQNSQTPRKSKRRCGASESRPEAPGSSRIITPPCRLVTEQPVVKRKASARMNNESSVDRTNVATTSSNGQGKAQLKRLDGEAEKGACALCDRFDSDRNIYFRMDNQDDLTAHYLCMFTASNLCQVEDPRVKKPGVICGFLTDSVIQERKRARKLRCKYCKKRGAAVGCAVKKCPASYHYPCGVQNRCFFNFTGSFASFCPDHIPRDQFPRPRDLSTVLKECLVCLDEPDLSDHMDSLITTCCHRAMHRQCLTGHAVNAGKHYIKCPGCNDVTEFRGFCDKVGIHVPNADATWLAEEFAAEQAEDAGEAEEVKCAAGSQCLCPRGLAFDEDVHGKDWNIERCHQGCGKLMHAGCMTSIGRIGRNRRNYCKECYELELKITRQLGRSLGQYNEDEGSPEIPEVPPMRTRTRGPRR